MLQEAPHLTHHIFLLQAMTQALADALAAQLAVDADANNETVYGRELPFQCPVLTIVNLNLDGTDGTLRCVEVCDVVQRLVALKNRLQLLQGTVLQLFPQRRVLRHSLHLVAF